MVVGGNGGRASKEESFKNFDRTTLFREGLESSLVSAPERPIEVYYSR